MKKMLFALGLTFCIGVTEACINDPTESTEVGTDTSTVAVCSNGQITDAVTQLCVDATDTSTDTSTETVVDTDTETAVE